MSPGRARRFRPVPHGLDAVHRRTQYTRDSLAHSGILGVELIQGAEPSAAEDARGKWNSLPEPSLAATVIA